jgi:hypothetical protein
LLEKGFARFVLGRGARTKTAGTLAEKAKKGAETVTGSKIPEMARLVANKEGSTITLSSQEVAVLVKGEKASVIMHGEQFESTFVDDFVKIVSESVSAHGEKIKEVELLICNAGCDPKKIKKIAKLMQADVVANQHILTVTKSGDVFPTILIKDIGKYGNDFTRALYIKGEGWYLVDKDGNFVRMINRVKEVSK